MSYHMLLLSDISHPIIVCHIILRYSTGGRARHASLRPELRGGLTDGIEPPDPNLINLVNWCLQYVLFNITCF